MKVIVLQEGSRPNEIGYHFTDFKGLAGILNSDCLFATNEEDLPPTISYTRKSDGMYYRNMVKNDSVRIVLDIDKISEHYKIKPFSWRDISKNAGTFEFEERIEGKKLPNGMYGLTNVSDYIKEITLTSFMEKALGDKTLLKVNPEVIKPFNYITIVKSLKSNLKYIPLQVNEKEMKVSEEVKGIFYSKSAGQISNMIFEYFKKFKESQRFVHFNVLQTFLDTIKVQFNLLANARYIKWETIKSFQDNPVLKNLLDYSRNRLDLTRAWLPVSEKDRKAFKKEAKENLQNLKSLKLKNGRSVSSLKSFEKYLAERGIKLKFMNTSNNILGATFIYPEDEEKSKKKLENMIVSSSQDALKLAEQLEKLVQIYKTDLGEWNESNKFIIPGDKCYKGFQKAADKISKYNLLTFFKKLGIQAKDQFKLVRYTDSKNMCAKECKVILTNRDDSSIKLSTFTETSPKYVKRFISALGLTKKTPYISGKQLKDKLSDIQNNPEMKDFMRIPIEVVSSGNVISGKIDNNNYFAELYDLTWNTPTPEVQLDIKYLQGSIDIV